MAEQDNPDLENIDEKDTTPLGSENEPDNESDNTPTEDEEETTVDPEKVTIETREKKEEKVEYGEDIDPNDVATIGTIVEKQTAGMKQVVQDQQDRAEVDGFVAENPQFAKYKPVILKYLKHPVYSNIPVKNIAYMVASGDLLKLGAKAEREAQAKADATKNGGQAVRRTPGQPTDWTKAPKAEFEAKKAEVLGHGGN